VRVPFGPAYAHALAKRYGSPEEYERQLDRMLMFLAKYAHQNAIELEREPTIKLMSWVDRISDMHREEQEAADAARKR
jgi:hypothetical protein